MFSKSEVSKYIGELIDSNTDLFLYDLVLPSGDKGQLEVFIAKKDKSRSITHDDCAKVSHLLDEAENLEHLRAKFGMSVSSPGVNRKLKTKEHYNYAKGENIKIHYVDSNGKSVVQSGVLKDFCDDQIKIDELSVSFQDVKKAHVDFIYD